MTDRDIILSYPKLEDFLMENPQHKDAVIKNIDEISGNFNPNLVKSAIRLIDATFGKLYDGVNLEVPQGFDLETLARDNHIILVPNHQSHADYIALTYALFGVYEVPIYIAGGINLNIFPIGAFFRNSGAFFIRRKFHDDPVYKHTFEAYIYYLLKTGKVVEFFFEGGRSRTGKLLKPRFGLFQMLLETHSRLENSKPLMFLPVALAHEYIPEEKAHAKELSGAKKAPEKTSQLLKVFKLFNKKLGTIHVRISRPIVIDKVEGDIKALTQQIAFDCFNSVADAMPITPTSLLSLILLDEPSGAITWENIHSRAKEIITYANACGAPVTPSLKGDEFTQSLKKALDLYVTNSKVKLIRREKLNETFYSVRPAHRVELLYSKNMILHHFLVAGFINTSIMGLFRGDIKTPMELTRYLMERRKEFKYEFYLPPVKAMVNQALKIINDSVGREFDSLEGSLDLSNEQLFKIANAVKSVSTAFIHIYEAYYLACLAVEYLKDKVFTQEEFINTAKELFELEMEHGRIIRYRESFTVPKVKDALTYLVNLNIVSKDSESFSVSDKQKLSTQKEKLHNIINDQLSINLKLNQ